MKSSVLINSGFDYSRRKFLKNISILPIVPAGIGLGVMPFNSAKAQTEIGDNVKALTFDVFGTVVDWRSSIIREGQLLSANKGYEVDWPEFADRWRGGYGPAMNQVRTLSLIHI